MSKRITRETAKEMGQSTAKQKRLLQSRAALEQEKA